MPKNNLFDLPSYPKSVDIGSPDAGYVRGVTVALGLTVAEQKLIKSAVRSHEEKYRDAFREVSLQVQKTLKTPDLMSAAKRVKKAVDDSEIDCLSAVLPTSAQDLVSTLEDAAEDRREAAMNANALIALRRKAIAASEDPDEMDMTVAAELPLVLRSQLSVFTQLESAGATRKYIDAETKVFCWVPKDEEGEPSKGFASEDAEDAELKNS